MAAAPDRLRAALERADLYPGPPERVEVHETHVSCVFVAGERAYKLKKPLVLPFLDYGTPARRRAMCDEEVRLNRRLAPAIYLGVRAIRPTPVGFELADADAEDAEDYLVEMRRFDEADTLAGRLADGRLTDADDRAVARRLAAFHAAARRVPATGRPVVAVERRMAVNAHELLALVDQRSETERVLALERFVHAFVGAHAGLLDARARRGQVRELHGDLRAEHVLLATDVQVVDCIEFDRELRELDVGDELAFLVMDLTALGGERFARVLVDAYRDAGGDPGDDALIAFYATYRALVRAKVALLRAGQLPASDPAHGRESAAARDLLALAERFAWRARTPLAIVLCGVPASGKSHLASALAERSGLAHLSSDVTRKRLAGLPPTDRAEPADYGPDASRRTYADLGRRAAQRVAAAGGVLIDATFRHRADRDAFRAGFGEAAPLLYVECRVPAAELERRARTRDRDPARVSDADVAVVLREAGTWEPLDEVAADAHVTLRADRPVAALVDDLIALLDRHAPLPPG
jgi:aminoglycoside phosphotransferase family enzyme/predicted kinase